MLGLLLSLLLQLLLLLLLVLLELLELLLVKLLDVLLLFVVEHARKNVHLVCDIAQPVKEVAVLFLPLRKQNSFPDILRQSTKLLLKLR